MGLKSTLEETLETIIRKADEMRDKGIIEIEGDGIRVRLAPKDPPAPPVSVTDDAKEAPIDPLEDPDTFGGQIPRRRGAPVATRDEDE